MPSETLLHWEHGYRRHGYWLGVDRLGTVGLGHPAFWDGVYRWTVDATGEVGQEATLRKAKRAVERRVAGLAKTADRCGVGL